MDDLKKHFRLDPLFKATYGRCFYLKAMDQLKSEINNFKPNPSQNISHQYVLVYHYYLVKSYLKLDLYKEAV